MRPSELTALVVLAFAGCAHDLPAQNAAATASPGASGAAAPQVAPKPDPLAEDTRSIARTLASYLRAQDDALWAQWTVGTPYDAEALRTRFPGIFRADAVLTLRQAKTRPGADPRALSHLEAALAGLQISVASATSETALANLEASLTFHVDGRDVPWRELTRLLANEPSAIKRKALWAASHRAAERLGALIDVRDAAVGKAHHSLSLEPDTFSEARLELDLDAAAELAEAVLSKTDAEWRGVLERRARDDLKLPLDRVSRADLPRLMRTDPRADLVFPKELQAARGKSVFDALGLSTLPGFELALDEARVKGVLPLSLLPAPFDARLAVRPRSGLRAQAALLQELGRVAALYGGSAQRFEHARLGSPIIADVTGALFESLLGQPAWLASQQLSAEAAQAAARSFADAQLLEARRSAALVLAAISAHELGPTEAQEQWRAALSRALALPIPLEETARWKLELDSGLTPAHTLRVRALAAWLAARLTAEAGPAWWTSRDAASTLRALWSSGTAAPIDERLPPIGQATEAFVASLAGKPWTLPTDGGTWRPSTFAPVKSDGGMWAPVAWGVPPPMPAPVGRPGPNPGVPRTSTPDAGTADAGSPILPDAGLPATPDAGPPPFSKKPG